RGQVSLRDSDDALAAQRVDRVKAGDVVDDDAFGVDRHLLLTTRVGDRHRARGVRCWFGAVAVVTAACGQEESGYGQGGEPCPGSGRHADPPLSEARVAC